MTHKLGNGCEQSKKTDEFVDGIEEIYYVQKKGKNKSIGVILLIKAPQIRLTCSSIFLIAGGY